MAACEHCSRDCADCSLIIILGENIGSLEKRIKDGQKLIKDYRARERALLTRIHELEKERG